MTTNKIRSKNAYWHEYPDGSGIKTNAFLNGYAIRWHLRYSKEIKEDQEITWTAEKYSVDSTLNSPIGGNHTVSTKEKKEFAGTLKQYHQFVIKFWENGPDYYDSILSTIPA